MKRVAQVFSLVNILLFLLSALVSVLLFVQLYKGLPVFGWSYEIERAIMLVFMVALTFFFAKKLKGVFVLLIIGTIAWLGYDFYFGKKDLLAFYNHSRNIFNDMAGYKEKGTFVYTSYSVFYRDRQLLDAIDHKDPSVRTFAIGAANEFFKKEQKARSDYNRVLVQSLAVFKKINSQWNYVSDPDNDEYFAKASESVKLMAGDCDDYSVLMAGAIKSIGGKVRLTFIKGHIYPELFIGSEADLAAIVPLITEKLFPKESKGKQLNYYKDSKGNTWINLDYTANYPGGGYMGTEVVEYIYP
ncbi:MAG: transglutaminase [Chitinophagaceae bacterium]|jgi:transglutaminase-like putative cysteine protease|nr:transglutaminase [Chitinophagaceae bacterium]